MNRDLILCVLIAALLCAGQQLYWQKQAGGLQGDLAAQTARADAAEVQATALQGVNAYRAIQLSALQGQALLCEKARRQEAANAAERRAILGPARAEQRQSAQGGIASPRVSNQGENAHDAARRAVAARLNRPL